MTTWTTSRRWRTATTRGWTARTATLTWMTTTTSNPQPEDPDGCRHPQPRIQVCHARPVPGPDVAAVRDDVRRLPECRRLEGVGRGRAEDDPPRVPGPGVGSGPRCGPD